MYILLTGIPPFNGENDNQIFSKIRIGNFDLKRKKMIIFEKYNSPSLTQAVKIWNRTDQTNACFGSC